MGGRGKGSRRTPAKRAARAIAAVREDELKKFDRMDEILNQATYDMSQDIDLVFELLGYGHLLEYSLRMADLSIKAKRYRKLTQYAAKEKLWEKIHGILYGLKTEVALARNSRDRGGTKVQ